MNRGAIDFTFEFLKEKLGITGNLYAIQITPQGSVVFYTYDDGVECAEGAMPPLKQNVWTGGKY